MCTTRTQGLELLKPFPGNWHGTSNGRCFEEPACNASLCAHPRGKRKPDLSDERDTFFISRLCFVSLKLPFVYVLQKEGVFQVS